jgi:hypothetical protein
MSSRRVRPSHSYDTSSQKQGFQPLLDNDLSSTNVPLLLARQTKQLRLPLKWRALRLLSWALGVGIIFWFASSMLRSEKPPSAINYLSSDGKAYEIVSEEQLLEIATPIIVTDKRGRSRWTVSIPPSLEFPLRPAEYADLCTQIENAAQQVSDIKHPNSKHHLAHTGYYYVDPNFMDVADAEEHGMLPGLSEKSKKDIWGNIMVESGNDNMGEDVVTMQGKGKGKFCEKSLTYVMETGDAGMGNTLMALWMSYGLAQKEGRAFFIDDTYWAYGNFTTFFKPPPKPTCLPPPRTQMLPCPHHARHLLVSSGTIRYTFGHKFHEQFEDAHKMEVYRLKKFFDFMRIGYEALFDLTGEDGAYLVSRVDDLNNTIRGKGGLEIGIHVRHGDRHPMEYKYQKSYLPLEKYVEAARDIIADFGNSTSKEDFPSMMASKMLLASDDPDVYHAPEFSQAQKAQTRITLASKTRLDASDPSSPSTADGNLGFEGGFFKDVFWSLGQGSHVLPPDGSPLPSKRHLAHPYAPRQISTDHRHPLPEAMAVRGMIGRAYLLDLAVLGQADRIACGVSSNTCRILAVMMGWERAIVGKEWRNVDGDWDWNDIAW